MIFMKETLNLVKEMVKDKEQILMDLSIKENMQMINPKEEVIFNYLQNTGLYIWKDGERYEGEWRDGKFHGKGIKTLPDGTIFDGEWTEGRPQGMGMCKYPDGAKYTGNWQNG